MSAPPVPEARPTSRTLFGETLIDEYAWLRDKDDPAVEAHVRAEKAHAEAVIDARTGDLRERLYAEMRARIKEDDRSVPTKDGPWRYYSRTEVGDEYPRHCRTPAGEGEGDGEGDGHGDSDVYLDENALAHGCEYFDLASLAIDPGHRLCAYAVDTDGDEIYTIYVKDLETGALLEDQLEGCGRSLAWGDGGVLFYDRLDDAHRPWQVWRHQLGTPTADDALVVQEDDDKFFLSIGRSRSDRFVVVSADSKVTSEVSLIPSATPTVAPQVVAARVQDVEYEVSHRGEQLLVLTNADGATNFKLMVAPLPAGLGGDRDDTPWRELIPHREDVLIEQVDAFAGHLVVWERTDGLQRIRIVPLASDLVSDLASDLAGSVGASVSTEAGGEHLLAFPDPTYSVWAGANPEFDTGVLRFGYTSMTTPASVIDYDVATGEQVVRKRTEIVGGHAPTDYRSARLWATAADGERIPISLVWHRKTEQGGARPGEPAPMVLYGYGAYGCATDPTFSSTRLSLLDRGCVWAIAHVRGGDELGRRWYDAGKLEHKHNTFDDFIACAEHLISDGWTSAERLVGMGGSAGGLLIGAVANARPDLFTALVADVPFVDVLNTMLDPSLPLTVIEWEEWGNPATEDGYRWIRSYSPYDNVREQAYPAILALAGWNDPRVGYWEAAKWVARLRERAGERASEVLLWTNMGAGHGGASGRFEFLRELGLEYAFVIDRLGLPAVPE